MMDNTLRNLPNSSYPTKAKFITCFIIHSKYIILSLLSCIVFVLPYIPVRFYIYPLLPCIVCIIKWIIVIELHYQMIQFLIIPCIAFVLPYTPSSSTYTLYLLVSSLYSHISPCPSTSTLYSLVSSLYSHISPYSSSGIYGSTNTIQGRRGYM